MAYDRIQQATRKGFFADLSSNVLAEFQFNPTEITLPESSEVQSRTPTGREEPDLLWVKGAGRSFRVDLFIDRTAESKGRGLGNTTVNDYARPDSYYWGPGSEVSQNVRAVGDRVDRTLNRLEKLNPPAPEFNMSDYNPSPHVNPDDDGFREDVGVYGEYQKFLRMKRSEGYENPDRRVAMLLGRDVKFAPPPLIVFFFGDLWVEGYVTELTPKFSVFTKELVPQRLELEVTMSVLASGILAPVPQPISTRSVQADTGLGGFTPPPSLPIR